MSFGRNVSTCFVCRHSWAFLADVIIFTLDFKNKMPLLVFKNTASQTLLGHVTDTRCRPDITAAFEDHWQLPLGLNTKWPLIRLAGEDASKGKSKEEHKMQ